MPRWYLNEFPDNKTLKKEKIRAEKMRFFQTKDLIRFQDSLMKKMFWVRPRSLSETGYLKKTYFEDNQTPMIMKGLFTLPHETAS